jgi:hypothetical protein
MKKILIVSTFAALFALATSAFATDTNTPATNAPQSILNQVKADVKAAGGPTNLNEVVIGILQGVKTCSGEVYDASKTAIIQSVDFAKEQAPLVVKEFLRWKMAEAVIYAVIWSIPALTLFWFARKARILAKSDKIPESSPRGTDKWDLAAWKWVLRVVGLVLIMINISINGMTITKIAIAPRVFLIEYVVDTIHTMHNSN